MVKHVVKCEKWACSTLKVGKNKPIDYITNLNSVVSIASKSVYGQEWGQKRLGEAAANR